jgi:uncharacterized RDD family membrane protein YckC
VALDNVAEVETPEQVRFRYRLAGPGRRGLAYLIDLALRGAVLLVIFVIASLAFGVKRPDALGASTGVQLVVLFLLDWGYFVFFETTSAGRSPGKRALGLRVVKEGGGPIGFLDSVLRNLLRAADFLPTGYALGLLVSAGDARFRRLGDRLAGTMVIVEERGGLSAPLVLDPPPTAAELAALPSRPPFAVWEREAIDIFLRRTDLAPARRDELAGQVAPILARRVGMRPGDPVRFLALLHQRAMAQR